MTFTCAHQILERIVLRFSVQHEYIIEQSNDNCHVFTFNIYNVKYHVYTF